MKKLTKIIVLALCTLLALAPVGLGLKVVQPTADFYVADYANVLTDPTKTYIVGKNDALFDHCGAQIVVVTVDFLDGATSEDYAYALFNEWGIGDAEKNNGVLLLLAIGDQKYWAVTGQGLERQLTAGDLDLILYDHLEADFDAGDYDSAVLATFDALYSEVTDIYGTPAAGSSSQPYYDPDGYVYEEPRRSSGFGRFLIILLVIVVLVLVFSGPATPVTRRSYYVSPSPWRIHRPHIHIHTAPRPRPPHSGFGPRPGSRFSSRPSSRSSFGSSSRSSFGGSRSSFGGSRPRSGGGGRSRGGGAGRR